ncbi:MAG: hypothetical protein Q9217_002272 [Psora testacea]
MHILSTTFILLTLSVNTVLGGTYGWIAAYEQGDDACKNGYYIDAKKSVDKYRPRMGGILKPQIDWSPAALIGNNYNVTNFGVNWGTGGDGFQFKRLAFYANKGCSSGWLGTLERPPKMDYDERGVKTCFTMSNLDAHGVYQDGRAIQCIRSDKAEGNPPKGAGIVHITANSGFQLPAFSSESPAVDRPTSPDDSRATWPLVED